MNVDDLWHKFFFVKKPASSIFVPTTKEINMEWGFDHLKTSGYLMFQGELQQIKSLKNQGCFT